MIGRKHDDYVLQANLLINQAEQLSEQLVRADRHIANFRRIGSGSMADVIVG